MSPSWDSRPHQKVPSSKKRRDIHLQVLELLEHGLMPDKINLKFFLSLSLELFEKFLASLRELNFFFMLKERVQDLDNGLEGIL